MQNRFCLLKTVPGDRLPADRQQHMMDLHRQFGGALQAANLDWMKSHFAPDVVFESQAVLEPLHGAAAVLKHLERKFEAVSASKSRLELWLGVVGLPAAAEHPCLVAQQGDVRFLFALTEAAGLIERVDILTVAPSPASARCIEPIS